MGLFKNKPLETYIIRDEFGMARQLVVSMGYITAFGFFTPCIRIEPMKSSLINGE